MLDLIIVTISAEIKNKTACKYLSYTGSLNILVLGLYLPTLYVGLAVMLILFVKLTHVRLQRPRFKKETDYRHHFVFMLNLNQSYNFLKQSFPFVISAETKPIKFIVTFSTERKYDSPIGLLI